MSVRSKNLITIIDTAWLYPIADIQTALRNTSRPYTFDGTNIVVADWTTFIALYSDIFDQTAITQPVGNVGFSLGVGTMLEDRGKSIYFKLPSGLILLQWQLVKQLTRQVPGAIPSPGSSPDGTIGYVTVYTSYPRVSGLPIDNVMVARLG